MKIEPVFAQKRTYCFVTLVSAFVHLSPIVQHKSVLHLDNLSFRFVNETRPNEKGRKVKSHSRLRGGVEQRWKDFNFRVSFSEFLPEGALMDGIPALDPLKIEPDRCFTDGWVNEVRQDGARIGA